MSMNIHVNGSGDSLSRFNWTVAAVKWADVAGPLVRTALKEESPVGKGMNAGRLRDSIRYERKTGAGSIALNFGTGVPYAKYVVGGTVPHEIRPVAARSLHWVDGRGSHFSQLVHHPGTRPNRFPERALRKTLPVVQELFKKIVTDSLEGI